MKSIADTLIGLRSQAERLVGVEHASDELAGEHAWVVAAHDELEPSRIGHDHAGEPGAGVVAELGQAGLGLLGGGAAEVPVLVALDHRQQPLAAFQGLLGLDLGTEPRLRGADW